MMYGCDRRLEQLFVQALSAFLGLMLGCNVGGDPVDRVQTNLMDKRIFEGDWWYAQTAIDVDGDEAGITDLFEGFAASDWGLDVSGQSNEVWKGSYPLGRIRWVIDEDVLFAYRTFDLVDGARPPSTDSVLRGQPLAAFAIEGHVDVRQDYNPITGETTNVTIENTDDRRWFDRAFMRVDWSQNLLSGPFFGRGTFKPTSFFIQEGGHGDFPESWQPQVVHLRDDPSYRFSDEWPDAAADTVHYVSFVTQNLFSPGEDCALFSGDARPCSDATVTMRHAFLRVPPDHGYAASTQTHQEFDRFGTLRTAQRTYVAGGGPRAALRQFCFADEECGAGGACETVAFPEGTFPVCVGGVTENRGETDFLNFFRPRHHIWKNALTNQQCLNDWECDGRYRELGGDLLGRSGSVCDPAANRCTIPLRDRLPRTVTYTLSPSFPKHLLVQAFSAVASWNEVFMRGARASLDLPLPSGPSIPCQGNDPTAYCFCDSPETRADRTCAYRYDPFLAPDDAAAVGVTDPYRCHVVAPERPTTVRSFDDYSELAYQTHFEGAECRFILESNACDRDGGAPCQELGDLRYQFLSYIAHGNTFFGGVAVPLVDPTTGELVHANVHAAATSVEDVGTIAREFFPVLRKEPLANDAYVEGETVRAYFARRGNVVNPTSALAASAFQGFVTGSPERPGLPTDMHGLILDRVDQQTRNLERLRGMNGRASIYSDRLRRLAGSPIERSLLASAGRDGWDALFRTTGASELPPASLSQAAVLERTSLFQRSAGLAPAGSSFEDKRANFPSGLVFDPPFAPDVESARFSWWAEAFRDRSPEEASIRMEQKYFEGVMQHELGHGLGLTHNFAASYDRDQYGDAFFHQLFASADGLAIPDVATFDQPSALGNGDGEVTGEELGRYFEELRRVRNVRSAVGLGRFATSSIMDYHGDLGILGGLGRYDAAATIWNHFDLVEVYRGDPVTRSTTTTNGLRRSDVTPREFWRSYRGGESCTFSEDCPFGPDNPLLANQPVFQRCIRNPREAPLPVACSGGNTCVCSTFDEDMRDFQANASPVYNSDPDRDGVASHFEVPYLFCSDFRTNDISWCSRNDAGESFQEAIDHHRRSWEQAWPLAYHRRFRRAGPSVGGTVEGIENVVKIYQHFFFRFFFEPGFRSDRGPLGVDDQFLASADGMNWLTEIATLPQPGSYVLDGDDQVYRHLGTTPGLPGATLNVPVGQGYPLWSSYQEGHNGFFREEKAGVFYDKYYALLGLSRRDWNLSFTVDERYFINFYDLFPLEMTEFFGGLILDNPAWFSPRVDLSSGDPKIQGLAWYRGVCPDAGGNRVPCRQSQPSTYPEPPLEGTSNEVLRAWATLLALAQFPVYFDPTFEQRLVVFRRGTGEGFAIPDVRPDGSPTCAYGTVALDASHTLGCADPDYIVYEASDQQQYLAVKVRSRANANLDEEMLGYQLLKQLVDRKTEWEALSSVAAPTPAQVRRLERLRAQLDKDESFLLYLIDIQERYGISAFFS